MNLKQKIGQDLKDAMKAGDAKKRDTLRFLDSAIKNVEIEKKKKETGLSDEEVLEVVARSVKQRKDSIEQYINGGRPDLAENEKLELEILQAYLPEQMSEEEIRKSVSGLIDGMGSVSANDMGKVIGLAMKDLKGKADGNVVRTIVEELLKNKK